MHKIDYCKMCGEAFVKLTNAHMYCCGDCRNKADKINRQRKKEGKTSKQPTISMNHMIETALRLSKERGRLVQYGEVQAELLTGKLKVKGGVIVESV